MAKKQADVKLEYKEVEVGGKKVQKVKAPSPENVNAPVYVERRKERAEKRRPEWVE